MIATTQTSERPVTDPGGTIGALPGENFRFGLSGCMTAGRR